MTARIPVLARNTAIAALLLSLTSGCASYYHASPTDALAGYQSDVGEIQMISAVVGGKNVFIPSTIVVTAGKRQTLSVFNTTDKPHGFAIKGLSIETVLYAGEETRIELPVLKGSEIYTIGCQLHPPHRTATLVVVPGR
ncbi:MAG: cupredoxin domain-containing protein [Myxococcales bacterium]|nr:cupredoxin domain-containing protein [Myxococcales bacterium]